MRPILFVALLLLFSCKQKTQFFELKSAAKTGIDFSNDIVATEKQNVVNYEYLYNGGGVGVGDFNNDGLADIYFTGNMVPAKMYINKGNFKFDDVTNKAGVTGENKWLKGVSVIDINNDGLLDLYVCAAVKKDAKQRANILYINQGVDKTTSLPVFKNMADEYGLADTSHSQMASFYDYDNDGDLDVFIIVNELEDKNPNVFKQDTSAAPKNIDRLFRNDWSETLKHPVFTDVSAEAGIKFGGYSLGLSTADINNDGWPDVYVSNDFLSNDLLYINNKNGTFSNRITASVKHTSRNGMGLDVADVNNDGLQDIIQLDMAPGDNYRRKLMFDPMSYAAYQLYDRYGYIYQYPRNVLQVNDGILPGKDSVQIPVFSDLAYFSGIAHTDWSWAALGTDLDNDGWKDILITNGLPKDMSDLDFMAFRDDAKDLMPLEEIMKQLPSVKLSNFVFQNKTNLKFEDKTIDWGWDHPSTSAGMAVADFDNDGDEDVVINNTNMPAFIFENHARQLKTDSSRYLRIKTDAGEFNKNGIGAVATIFYNGKIQVAAQEPFRGYLSSVENIIHFGVGDATKIDSLQIQWPGNKISVYKNLGTDTTYTFSETSSIPNRFYSKNLETLFTDITALLSLPLQQPEKDFIDFSEQRLIPKKLSQAGPAIAVGDLNSDGLEDLIIGGGAGNTTWFLEQISGGKFSETSLLKDAKLNLADDMGICIFDADNDGDEDVFIAKGGNEYPAESTAYADKFFRNNGKGIFSLDSVAIPKNYASKSCVKAADFNGDGFLDLFIGGRFIPRQYPLPTSGFIYQNDGKGNFKDVTQEVAPSLKNLGLLTDAIWTDADNDNDADLLIVGEWMSPVLLVNTKGTFDKKFIIGDEKKGWFNSIASADLDNDGDMDYVLGNFGSNAFLQPNVDQPVRMYVNDYDKSGKTDAVLSSFFPAALHGASKEYPVAGRDDLIKEMFMMRRRFPYYANYGKATMDSLFKKDERENEYIATFNFNKTCWIENTGGGNFEVRDFPDEAQWSPIFGIVISDVNADGNDDVIMIGNDYAMVPSMGRSSAFNGLVLLGNGKGDFKRMPIAESGFYVPGDGKSLVQVSVNGKQVFVASQNKDQIKAFSLQQHNNSIPLLPTEHTVTAFLRNGKQKKYEFYRGSSYLSQSGRFIVRNPQIEKFQIRNLKGEVRETILKK